MITKYLQHKDSVFTLTKILSNHVKHNQKQGKNYRFIVSSHPNH